MFEPICQFVAFGCRKRLSCRHLSSYSPPPPPPWWNDRYQSLGVRRGLDLPRRSSHTWLGGGSSLPSQPKYIVMM